MVTRRRFRSAHTSHQPTDHAFTTSKPWVQTTQSVTGLQRGQLIGLTGDEKHRSRSVHELVDPASRGH